ncbi:47_t:CDS:2 [Gigaspora margarita]|uniref:47_t:CDS:1 n=1 Tax=Gigaspora margarita TaxID=4874 RepID=A0ABN7UUV4_GIGMA|nr:47_t:CDS:2 [Gigaspora margarita]
MLLDNCALISEGSQSTIISDISCKTFESEFYSNIEQGKVQDNQDINDICKGSKGIQL